jgi:hypothetical protein
MILALVTGPFAILALIVARQLFRRLAEPG